MRTDRQKTPAGNYRPGSAVVGGGGGARFSYKKKGPARACLGLCWVFSLKGFITRMFFVPFVLNGNNITRLIVVLELVTLRGEKHCNPRPRTRIFEPLRGLFPKRLTSNLVLFTH